MTTLTMTVPLFKSMVETLKSSSHPTQIFLECTAATFLDAEIQAIVRSLPVHIAVAPVTIKQDEPQAISPKFTLYYYKELTDAEPTRSLFLQKYDKDYLTSYFRTPWVDELFDKKATTVYTTIYNDPESGLARLVLHHEFETLKGIIQMWKESDGKASKY